MHNMIIVLSAFCLFQLSHGLPDDQNFGHERVVDNILQNYGQKMRYVRPSQNTTAQFGIALAAIKSFNQANGRLTGHYWLRETWKDARLAWEDSSVENIRIPTEHIWKPDYRLYNSVDAIETLADTLSVVSRDGTVLWVPNVELTTACPKSEDEDNMWTCTVTYGPWTFNNNEVRTEFYGEQDVVDITFFKPELWGYKVETKPGNIEVKEYDCCPGVPYAKLNFIFTISKIEGGVADSAVHLFASGMTLMFGLILSKI